VGAEQSFIDAVNSINIVACRRCNNTLTPHLNAAENLREQHETVQSVKSSWNLRRQYSIDTIERFEESVTLA
jgi:RNase P subunit RPR2